MEVSFAQPLPSPSDLMNRERIYQRSTLKLVPCELWF